MQKLSTDQYNEIFDKLPQEIKDVVATMTTTNRLYAIGQKHNFHIDQIGKMHDIAMDVMMGIIPSKNMVTEVSENLQISRLDAATAVRDIDDEIFKPIKEIMIRVYADGAPYRPKSMNTVEETDEDHQNLDKNEILREIENPPEAQVKKIENNTISNSLAQTKSIEKEKTFAISDSKTMEEFHQEISPVKKEEALTPKNQVSQNKTETQAPSVVPKVSSLEETKKRILENITAQKLSGVVTMPTEKIEIKREEVKTPEKATSVSPQKPYVADPYRESL